MTKQLNSLFSKCNFFIQIIEKPYAVTKINTILDSNKTWVTTEAFT